jgi:hypothetical protein
MMTNPAVGQAFLTPALQDLVRRAQPSQPFVWPSVACLLGQNQGPCWHLRLVVGSGLWSLQWGQVILPWHHARGYCGDRSRDGRGGSKRLYCDCLPVTPSFATQHSGLAVTQGLL